MKGTNSKQSKTANLRLVLNLITTRRPISRVEISRQTTLTKQTISNLADELAHAGLICETGIHKEGVGKPSKLLNLNPDGAYTLGLRAHLNTIEAGVFNITGDALLLRQFPLPEFDIDTLPDTLAAICNKLVKDSAIDSERLLGTGLVLPPPQTFKVDQGKSEKSAALTDVTMDRIKQQLIDKTGIPVVRESTAAAVSASEMLHGAAKELESFVYIHLGSSLEAGIVFKRQLFTGYNGITGRLGHIIVMPDGILCDCGNNGCLDQYASLGSLRKMLGKQIEQETDWLDFLNDANAQSKELESWFEHMSEPMRIALNMIENLINAQTVILGGDVPNWFLDQFIRKLRPFIPSVAQYGERELPRLIRAPSLENMALKGAATLPVFSAISIDGRNRIDLSSIQQASNLQRLVYA